MAGLPSPGAQDPPRAIETPEPQQRAPQDPEPPPRRAPGDEPSRTEGPQEPRPQAPPAQSDEVFYDPQVLRLQRRTVQAIRVQQVDRQGQLHPLPGDAAEAILNGLATRVGQPFEVRKVSLDVYNLWHERRIAVRAFAREAGDQVEVILQVQQEVQLYERVEFKGLERFDRPSIDALLGLYPDRQVTSTEAEAMRKVLIARYKREGYAFCSIDLQEREPRPDEITGERARKILTFRIDEGPKVTIGDIHFRGNASFPAEPALGFFGAGDYLVREAHLQSDPAGLAAGGPFSLEVIEEDLDRLRLFYRSRGFLDASVELADVAFHDGREVVDLDVLVVEGPRYRIGSVRVQFVDQGGKPIPPESAAYPLAEVEAVLRTKPGEFYDHATIRRDRFRLEEFYGKRGHPSETFPGMRRIPGAFRVAWPKEHYGEEPTVDLVFELYEGLPKDLREVLIRGNTYTRDAVIRRKVYAMPGERIDMTKVERSIRYLDQTRFFQNPATLQGPQFELLPVPGSDEELDLAIDVTEGETGDLKWGFGIGTGTGAFGVVEFRKRNFDLFNPPSAWDPVTLISELLDNRAFHGGGQVLNLRFAPGTEITEFRVEFTEPDLFASHFDTIELRVNGWRRIRRYREGYTTDSLGADLGLSRNFTEEFSAGFAIRQETVDVEDVSGDAAAIVFDAEGQTELRGLRLRASYRDLDNYRRPTKGFVADASYEVLGGPFGADEDMWKIQVGTQAYVPLAENSMGHRTVLQFEQSFGWAQAYGDSDDVFLTERFYLGGNNLRGFDYRGAGPTQFGQPIGGEAVFSSTLQLGFPLVATRLEQEARDRELLRGVTFFDFGLLGTAIDDPSFREPRLSWGVGLRIDVPVLEIPIALDLAWPLLFEESDDRRQFFFSISPNW